MDMSFQKAIASREHLVALGQTRIYLYGDNEKTAPWDKVVSVEAGSSWRLNGPASARLIAEVDGLEFSWNVDFECRDANGRGVSLFDRDGLREVMRKIPAPARIKFAEMMAKEVLPALQKNTAEIREALNKQQDSEDCVHGLISFANKIV